MPSSTVQNPPVQTESKSAKKKKTKVDPQIESPAPSVSPAPEKSSSVSGAYNGQDENGETAYIRELQK